MIKILTLLLGLMEGSSEIELKVAPEVSRVEIRVDGRLQHELVGPPWRAEVDWGEGLLPHELVASAFDSEGRELDRDRRWINMQGSEADALLSFPAPTDGKLAFAELRWATVGLLRPKSVSAHWGDTPLAVDADLRIGLPDYDPDKLHWLSVAVDFGSAGQRLLGASIGGESLYELSTELTAVPVRARSRRAASRRAGEIEVHGRSPRIHGIERGTAEVIVVVDAGAAGYLARLANLGQSESIQLKNSTRRGGEESVPREAMAGMDRKLGDFGRLGRGTTLSFIWPRSSPWSGPRLAPDSFPVSPERPLSEMGFLAANHGLDLTVPELPDDQPFAVAIAGLSVAGTTQRRAVVLIAERPAVDPEAVADTVRFLEVSKVPLHVWTMGPEVDPGPWPNVRHLGDFSRPSRLRSALWSALKDLREDLDDQMIVWIKGNYLPQAITMPSEMEVTVRVD